MFTAFIQPSQLRRAFWVCALAVLVLSLMPGTERLPSTGWDKSNHLLAFGALALLGCLGWPGWAVRLLMALLAYGALIEILQSLTPYRFAEWADLLADALGLLLGWTIARWLAHPGVGESAADQSQEPKTVLESDAPARPGDEP